MQHPHRHLARVFGQVAELKHQPSDRDRYDLGKPATQGELFNCRAQSLKLYPTVDERVA